MKSEIKISHIHLETPLIISEDKVQLLIVENPSEFYKMVCDMHGQIEGGEGLFVFSNQEGEILASKIGDMILNIFNFQLNDKKVLNLLYKKLEKIAYSEKVSHFNELNSKAVSFLEELKFLMPFSLDYLEPQPIDYFKTLGVSFSKNYESLEEKIICYLNALIELKGCEFFVFVNLKSVLSDEKLNQLYAHCRAEQVGLLLIENAKIRNLLNNEKAVIITEDLCEILENY